MEVPAEHQALFQFWRFCYPIIDAARESCFSSLLSVAEGTQLRGIGAGDENTCEQLRLALSKQLATPLPPGMLRPELTVLELSERLGQFIEASEDDKSGFYQEFPQLAAEE